MSELKDFTRQLQNYFASVPRSALQRGNIYKAVKCLPREKTEHWKRLGNQKNREVGLSVRFFCLLHVLSSCCLFLLLLTFSASTMSWVHVQRPLNFTVTSRVLNSAFARGSPQLHLLRPCLCVQLFTSMISFAFSGTDHSRLSALEFRRARRAWSMIQMLCTSFRL